MKVAIYRLLTASLLLSFSHAQFTHAHIEDVRGSQMLQQLRKSEGLSVVYLRVRILDGINDEIEETLEYGRFFVLNKSVYAILNNMDLVPTIEGDESTEKEAYLEAAARSLVSKTDFSKDSENISFFSFGDSTFVSEAEQDEESMLVGILIEDKLKKHSVKEIGFSTLNCDARSVQKPGTYFIFGYGVLNGELFIWERSFNTNPGETEVGFDQYNAEVIGTL